MAARDFDADALLRPLLKRQRDVITRDQALAHRVTADGWRHRTRPNGPWRIAAPGVAYAFTGEPNRQHRYMAAQLYAGEPSALTSRAALTAYGLKAPASTDIDVLIPSERNRKSVSDIRLHRTRRMPQPVMIGPIHYAPPARAIADFVRATTDMRAARAVVAEALQRGSCSLRDLNDELGRGPIRNSALLRDVLAEATSGAASIAEADALRMFRRAGIPEPLCNVDLIAADGGWIARPDFWWPHSGVALEIDSREWHISPEAWERTMARHSRMSAHGIIVIHVAPRQLSHDPDTVLATLAQALRSGRTLPNINSRAA